MINMLIGAKSITFYLISRTGGCFLQKKNLKFQKNNNFILLQLIFSGYYCSIDFKKQLENSGLCSDIRAVLLGYTL